MLTHTWPSLSNSAWSHNCSSIPFLKHLSIPVSMEEDALRKVSCSGYNGHVCVACPTRPSSSTHTVENQIWHRVEHRVCGSWITIEGTFEHTTEDTSQDWRPLLWTPHSNNNYYCAAHVRSSARSWESLVV